MEESLSRLSGEIADGLFTKGVQASISIGEDTVLEHVGGEDGLGRPVTGRSLFRVYCSIKPVTALAVGHLIESGVLSVDEPLADRLPTVAALRDGVTLRHVMTHSAGLHRPTGVEVEMTPYDRRRALLDRQEPIRWQLGHDAAYSEFFGWYVLGRLVEEVAGEELRVHLRRVVLDPLGMQDTFIGMTTEEYAANFDRLGVNVDMRELQTFPMLFERTERICREVNCAHNGYTTARDLGTFYRSLLRARRGEAVEGLPSAAVLDQMCSPARPTAFDVILDRECDYGLGFMVDLAGHAFGLECSPSSFGHSGNVGSSFAFADPTHDLAVAVVFNGIVDAESAFLRRPALVRAIYRDLGLVGGTSEPPVVAAVEGPRGDGDEGGGADPVPTLRRKHRFRRRH